MGVRRSRTTNCVSGVQGRSPWKFLRFWTAPKGILHHDFLHPSWKICGFYLTYPLWNIEFWILCEIPLLESHSDQNIVKILSTLKTRDVACPAVKQNLVEYRTYTTTRVQKPLTSIGIHPTQSLGTSRVVVGGGTSSIRDIEFGTQFSWDRLRTCNAVCWIRFWDW